MNYNIEFEKMILAAVKNQNSIYDDFDLKVKDFYHVQHQIVWQSITRLINRGIEANDITILDDIRERGLLGKIDIAYIACMDIVTLTNITFYVDKIKELSKKRQLEILKTQITDDINSKLDSAQIIENIELRLMNISQNGYSETNQLDEILRDTMNEIEYCYHHKNTIIGIPSGYKNIDEITNGFQKGELIIMGSRPGIGKTSLALNMAVYQLGKGIHVGFFSCEMDGRKVMKRIISAEKSINSYSINRGLMTETTFDVITEVVNNMYQKPFYIDDRPNINIIELKRKARQMKRKGVQIIYIDYITLLRHPDRKKARFEQVGDISKVLKQMARELDIPVIALSQLTRGAQGRVPTLADLRASGEIEQDADVIMFICREENDAEIIFAKNRNGACGTVELKFELQYTKFRETLKLAR